MKFKRDYKIAVTADMNDRIYWQLLRKGEPVNPSDEDKQVVKPCRKKSLTKSRIREL